MDQAGGSGNIWWVWFWIWKISTLKNIHPWSKTSGTSYLASWMKTCKRKIEILSRLSVWCYPHHPSLQPPVSWIYSFLFKKNSSHKHLLKNAQTCGRERTNPPQNCLVNAACSVKDHPADKEGRSKAWRAARTSRGQAWEANGDELWKASQQKVGQHSWNTEIETDDF